MSTLALDTTHRENTYFFIGFVFCIALLAGLSLYFFPHVIEGDAVGYINAMEVLSGGEPTNFADGELTMMVTKHRILTAPFSVETLRIFSALFDSIPIGWLVWDTVLFFGVNLLFFLLLLALFESPRVAFVGGLFFAGNYSMLAQGLSFFVDMAGWFFFVLSVFYLYTYLHSGRYRHILFATLAVAVGAFFKENALVGAIPIAVILLYENFQSPRRFLLRSIPLGLMVLLPVTLYHWMIYVRYDYVYTEWVQLTRDLYHYPSRTLEYVKSLGSLLTFLAPLSLIGAWYFVRSFGSSTLDAKSRVFILSVVLSALPALAWQSITQRVLFMVVPGCVLLACIFIKRHERYWYAFLPVALLYILAGFFMDSLILDFVNLPF
ncbi:hypothetical protein EXS56_00910 [Candidatus Kaiserbacteria bacterium]|nr:hypothetical protein [Candidatus Kaiserbacteria bacterium]